MDVVELLGRAAAVVPASVTDAAGATVTDVREHLQHDEWQLALDLLADLDRPADAAWWDLLIEVAESLRLAGPATRCRWRRFESIHGVIRADLTLRLRPSQTITTHEGRPVRGTATITDRRFPADPPG